MAGFIDTEEVQVTSGLELTMRLAAHSVLSKLGRLEYSAVGVVDRVHDQLRPVPITDPIQVTSPYENIDT